MGNAMRRGRSLGLAFMLFMLSGPLTMNWAQVLGQLGREETEPQ